MSEWKEGKLGEISDVRDGTHDSPKQKDTGKFLITSRHLKNGKIDFSSAYRISLEDFDAVNRRSKVDHWDILFSMIGTVGEMVIVDFDPDFAIKNVGLFKTGSNKDLSQWIYYYLKSKEALGELDACLKGSTQPYITLGDLRNFPIKLPPLPEQKAIAGVLSSLDDKIDLLHRQNKTLEAMAETLFRQWFVEEADEGWNRKKLSEICEIRNGYAFKSETYQLSGITIIRTINFSNHFIELDDLVFISDQIADNYSKYYLSRNEFLLVMVGASLGNYAIVTKDILPALQNQNMWAFKAFNPSHQYFLNQALKRLIEENLQSASGSAREFFHKSVFYEFDIIFPNDELLVVYNNVTEYLFRKIEMNRIQIHTLEKLRDTLLPKLMSGEVRIKDLQKEI